MNEARLRQLAQSRRRVELSQLLDPEVEADEIWSVVQSKQQQRWFWHALDHETREILAYVLSYRKDAAFFELKTSLVPFGITQFYTDDWGTYTRYLESNAHTIGKANAQGIERKHLTLRTRIQRLARRTICFPRPY